MDGRTKGLVVFCKKTTLDSGDLVSVLCADSVTATIFRVGDAVTRVRSMVSHNTVMRMSLT